MKTLKRIKSLLLFLAIVSSTNLANAQDANLPSEVTSILKMNLDDGQNKLKSLGYDICHSSFAGKSQDWYNETTKTCITIKFNKKTKQISEVLPNTAIADCQKGLEASRKVWEKYHDGQAPDSATKLDQERKKLSDQGFTVSHWIDEISPGRNMEYWVNDNTQTTMFIVWEKQSTEWVKTEKTEYSMGKNPSPIK